MQKISGENNPAFHHWSLGIDEWFQHTLYNGWNYLHSGINFNPCQWKGHLEKVSMHLVLCALLSKGNICLEICTRFTFYFAEVSFEPNIANYFILIQISLWFVAQVPADNKMFPFIIVRETNLYESRCVASMSYYITFQLFSSITSVSLPFIMGFAKVMQCMSFRSPVNVCNCQATCVMRRSITTQGNIMRSYCVRRTFNRQGPGEA